MDVASPVAVEIVVEGVGLGVEVPISDEVTATDGAMEVLVEEAMRVTLLDEVAEDVRGTLLDGSAEDVRGTLLDEVAEDVRGTLLDEVAEDGRGTLLDEVAEDVRGTLLDGSTAVDVTLLSRIFVCTRRYAVLKLIQWYLSQTPLAHICDKGSLIRYVVSYYVLMVNTSSY